MTSRWFLSMPRPDAACRGCGHALWRLEAPRGPAWVDISGYEVCVATPGLAPDVLHEPMPAGMPGAPVQLDPS